MNDKTLKKTLTTGAAVFGILAGLGFVASVSQAAVITNCPGGDCTLDELLAPGTFIQIGDKLLNSWSLPTGGNPDNINLSDIAVEGIFQDTNAPGIKFTASNGALSVPVNTGGNINLTFDFLVTSLGAPIVDNELILDDFVCQPDFVGAPCIIEIFENVGTSQGSNNLAHKSVEYEAFSLNPPGVVRDKQFDQAFFSPQQSIWVRKDINVSAGIEGNTELNMFSQRFSQQVPEPTSTLSLLTLGTLGAASTFKRQLKSSKKEETKVS